MYKNNQNIWIWEEKLYEMEIGDYMYGLDDKEVNKSGIDAIYRVVGGWIYFFRRLETGNSIGDFSVSIASVFVPYIPKEQKNK